MRSISSWEVFVWFGGSHSRLGEESRGCVVFGLVAACGAGAVCCVGWAAGLATGCSTGCCGSGNLGRLATRFHVTCRCGVVLGGG